MRCLVTGGAGFIGSHLTDELLGARSSRTRHSTTSPQARSPTLRHLQANPHFEYTIDSCTESSLVAELVDEADVVFHLAAAVGVKLIVKSPVRTIETNVQCTEVVLRHAAKKRRPVFIASTSEVYGKSADLPFREDGDLVMGAPHLGRWSYACSKAMDEFLALAHHREHGLPTVVGRLFNTVGPRQTGRYGMVVPTFVRQAIAGQPLTVYGDGSQRRCFCHVKDVVRAVVDLMAGDAHHGEVFNIGSREEVSIRDLAHRVRELTGSPSEIVTIPYDEAYEEGFEDMHRRVPDTSKLQDATGWRQTTRCWMRSSRTSSPTSGPDASRTAEPLRSVVARARRGMTRVLVTGGGGFIGSHLAEHLLTQGYAVRVLDNFSTGRRENLQAFAGEIDLIEGDVQSYERVTRAVAGCEVVFHQAALPSVPRSLQDPLTSHATNVGGTLNVLLAARDHEVRRVVCASSSSVYGANPELPKREDGATLPISPYATAKLAGEGYARSMHMAFGLDTVALRYFNVFGPRQDPTSQYAAVIPNFITAMLANRAPVVFGDGEQSRDFTFVSNVVLGNMLAMDAPEVAGGRVYNIACGQRVTLNALIGELRDLLGSDVEPEYRPDRRADVRHSLADLSRARQELGFEPLVGLCEGLQRTIEHFGQHQDYGARGSLVGAYER